MCFENIIDLSSASRIPEIQTSLRKLDSGKLKKTLLTSRSSDEWILNCRGFIHIGFYESPDNWAKLSEAREKKKKTPKILESLLSSCKTPVPSQKMYLFLRICGYHYGQPFQAAHNEHGNEERRQVTADVDLSRLSREDHPTSLDVLLHLCFTASSAGGTVPMATKHSIAHSLYLDLE
ncbi:hypothetical protein CP532_5120 [Ophiocordyceps camponoti-leonardi (nom. inval.)]|nr:hypothetical protein CP532_5120 [Ophiocordyceps camponoti-leonardi (nom. inval.)]